MGAINRGAKFISKNQIKGERMLAKIGPKTHAAVTLGMPAAAYAAGRASKSDKDGK